MEDDIDHLVEKYSEQEIIQLHYNLLNTTKVDERIIKGKIMNDENFYRDFKLKGIYNKLAEYFSGIRTYSLKPDKMFAKIRSHEEIDHLNVDTKFDYKTVYFSPVNYGFLSNPNSILFKLNWAAYNKRFTEPESFLKETELSTGVAFGYKTSKFSYFLSNRFYLGKEWELESKIKASRSEEDIKRKLNNAVFKTTLSKNFIARPFIFREKLVLDPISKLNFQYAHKTKRSTIDEFNCSTELLSNVPQEDSQHQFKISYINNILDFGNKNVSYFKFGSSIINTLNSTVLKHKVFYRKFLFWDNFIYQFNVELGNVTNLREGALRVHEKMFIRNFKGVLNPSRKAIIEEGKIN